jgi:Holliday junction DNA helicase RuvA
MYGFISGNFVLKEPTLVITETGGIGYELKISLNTFSKIKDLEKGKLFTHLQVKEDALVLYGFHDLQEKIIFLHLLSVSGVGPASALMILSSMGTEEVRKTIVHGSAPLLQKVKGIGAKTAQRIILELKDKLLKITDEEKVSQFNIVSHNTIREEALSALLTLGISRPAAEKSIQKVMQIQGEQVALEIIIKEALRIS